jgi:hypothetical protein
MFRKKEAYQQFVARDKAAKKWLRIKGWELVKLLAFIFSPIVLTVSFFIGSPIAVGAGIVITAFLFVAQYLLTLKAGKIHGINLGKSPGRAAWATPEDYRKRGMSGGKR